VSQRQNVAGQNRTVNMSPLVANIFGRFSFYILLPIDT